MPRSNHLSYPDMYLQKHKRVAGTGIEPVPGGYEPPEMPLLYPAIKVLRIIPQFTCFATIFAAVIGTYI